MGMSHKDIVEKLNLLSVQVVTNALRYCRKNKLLTKEK